MQSQKYFVGDINPLRMKRINDDDDDDDDDKQQQQ